MNKGLVQFCAVILQMECGVIMVYGCYSNTYINSVVKQNDDLLLAICCFYLLWNGFAVLSFTFCGINFHNHLVTRFCLSNNLL